MSPSDERSEPGPVSDGAASPEVDGAEAASGAGALGAEADATAASEPEAEAPNRDPSDAPIAGVDAQEEVRGAPQGMMPADLPGEGTPAGDKLRAAWRAFEAGDYVRVRELCDAVTGAQKDVADAARALRRRTQVDPMQIGVIAACLVFFLIIAYVYVIR